MIDRLAAKRRCGSTDFYHLVDNSVCGRWGESFLYTPRYEARSHTQPFVATEYACLTTY